MLHRTSRQSRDHPPPLLVPVRPVREKPKGTGPLGGTPTPQEAQARQPRGRHPRAEGRQPEQRGNSTQPRASDPRGRHHVPPPTALGSRATIPLVGMAAVTVHKLPPGPYVSTVVKTGEEDHRYQYLKSLLDKIP